jgi:dGTPase
MQHEALDGDLDGQMRSVCDFVAGMTDRYAMEFYGRLHSDSAQSMFKPIKAPIELRRWLAL